VDRLGDPSTSGAYPSYEGQQPHQHQHQQQYQQGQQQYPAAAYGEAAYGDYTSGEYAAYGTGYAEQQPAAQYSGEYAVDTSGQYAAAPQYAAEGYYAPQPGGYEQSLYEQAAYQQQGYPQQTYEHQAYEQAAYQQQTYDGTYEGQAYGYGQPQEAYGHPQVDVPQPGYEAQAQYPTAYAFDPLNDPLQDPLHDPMPAVPAQYMPDQHQQYFPEPEPQFAAQPRRMPDPEPEFDPEPAAWGDAVYVDPVDDLAPAAVRPPVRDAISPRAKEAEGSAAAGPAAARRAAQPRTTPRAAARSTHGSTASPTASRSTSSRSSSPGSSTSSSPSSPGGRAAARRAAAEAPARKSKRPLVAAGGAVVTGAVLAGVVAMQMPDGGSSAQAKPDTAHTEDPSRRTDDPASRSSDRGQVQPAGATQSSPAPGPSTVPIPTPTSPGSLTDRMKVKFDLDQQLALSGNFDVLPGSVKAPGSGKKYTYRIETERGLNLDPELFGEAVQTTLNDPRSWAHDGKTFERTDGKADFVIRLASPGTTNKLCGAVGLDTSEQTVSCDAAGTPYVVINAWRWAQGSETFGDEMVMYREMLINHEVGHRLGHGHEYSCRPDGLAPVMMQQTKTVTAQSGKVCKINAWPYPA
jgi:hypothetical protein